MTTLIHCHHCQEDMNSADWNANGERCLHCDTPLTASQSQPDRLLSPLLSLRRRMQLRDQLRLKGTPVYA
ncbi:MAG: hypothetical protein LBD30_05830 [Verrucomicrobiales bacterium]|jgi:hypothetical protein|nr:hypothetical protein [Verrucomicrobiales bacterium]